MKGKEASSSSSSCAGDSVSTRASSAPRAAPRIAWYASDLLRIQPRLKLEGDKDNYSEVSRVLSSRGDQAQSLPQRCKTWSSSVNRGNDPRAGVDRA